MKTRLAILLWATDPDRPHLCATPFFHAAAAAAMDAEVEVYFAARSVRLLVSGAADALYAGFDTSHSVAQHMESALVHGARFYACREALAVHQIDPAQLLSAVTGFAGAATFVSRSLDPEWGTLVF